ncbi:MAG: hypothetical protein WAT79_16220 [Saprospiraceae bacterium]
MSIRQIFPYRFRYHHDPFWFWPFLVFAGFVLPSKTFTQSTQLPWLNKIDSKNNIEKIHTISTHAEVTVSDGLSYKTNTLYHDKQRAIFQRLYKDRNITQGIEGKYLWSFDGLKEAEAQSFVENIILGHQFHAQILFFDRIHLTLDSVQIAEFDGKPCYALSCNNEDSNYRFYYEESGHPLGFEIIQLKEKNIVFTFDDWRSVSGIELPFIVWIDDGDRKFLYKFLDIILNEGFVNNYKAPDSLLTEEQKLIRKHRIIMDGHLFGQTNEIKNLQSDSMFMVSDGEIYHLTGNQSDEMMDKMMVSRDYTSYDDLVRPIVKISEDGKLGWVIAKVYAKGIRLDENGRPTGPLEFVSSWIELYEKINKEWQLKGNVSNFQPGRK